MDVINFPNCPYCGERMRYSSNITHAWFECESCQSSSPKVLKPDDDNTAFMIDVRTLYNERRKLAAAAAERRPTQRPLTLEELEAVPEGMLVWKEEKNAELVTLQQAYAYLLVMVYGGKSRKCRYGKTVRAWRRIPTEEEVAAAEWEV